MKKLLTMLLVFCMMFSVLLPAGIVSAEEEMKQTKLLVKEDFEGGTDGADIEGYNGWMADPGYAGKDDGTSTTDGKDKIIKIKDLGGNKVGSFTQDRKTLQNETATEGKSVAYWLCKPFEDNAVIDSGVVSVKFKLKITDDAHDIYIGFSSNQNYDAGFRLRSGRGLNATYTADGAFLSNLTGDWEEIEYRINLDNDELTYRTLEMFINGTEVAPTANKLKTENASSISQLCIALARFNGISGYTDKAGDGYLIDDIEVIQIAELDARITPTDAGELNKAKLTFNNAPVSGVSAANVKINIGGVETAATAIEPVDGDSKSYIVTFPQELEPGNVEYAVTLNGFTDVYGGALTNKAITLTTRAKRYEISDAAFFTDYATLKTPATSLSNGEYTAEFTIKNELAEEFVADMILVHKRGDEIIDAVAVDANVPAETVEQKVTASVNVSGATANDKLEVYLWDSVTGMDAYKPVKTLSSTGAIVDATSVAESSAATAISMNASVDFANEKITLAGSLTPEAAGEVAAMVFKSGYKLETLTMANIKDAVMCITQSASEADGSYSIDCKLINPEDVEYFAVAGADGSKQTDSALFFRMDTVNKAIAAVNNSTAEELAKLLAGETPLVGTTLLNAVLQMDMSVYDTLTYKLDVCSNMIGKNFQDVPAIRTAFAEAAAAQRAKEDRINALLISINDALWSEIEEILTTDRDSYNDLDLPWDGNYEDIEDDEDLLTAFYKKLASDYTFDDYLTLQEVFDDEAKAVLEEEEDNKKGSGGGGGGGGSLKYSPGLGSVNQLEPIPTQTETKEEKIVEFTDIDHVAWAKESIVALAAEGIIAGVGGDKFAPDLKVTRDQFIKMIVLAFDLYDKDATTDKFIDVPAGTWYSAYVASAVNSGIVYGVDDDHFGVGKEITRAEMATILARAAAAAGKTINGSGSAEYADAAIIPEYARESITALSKAGIMSGVGENMFAPHDKATRAMAAKVIYLLKGAF